jgi:hypothetical protein
MELDRDEHILKAFTFRAVNARVKNLVDHYDGPADGLSKGQSRYAAESLRQRKRPDGRWMDFSYSYFFNQLSIDGKFVVEAWVGYERKQKKNP